MPGFFFGALKRMSKVWLLIAVLGLTLAIYWVGLNGPLLFDDAQNLAPINAWLQGRIGWESVVFGNASGQFGRSISMASFVANAALFGSGIWSFKLVNLLIHLLNGIAVFALLSGVNRRMTAGRPDRTANLLPLLATAIWLVHPLLVSTVLYVVQRMALLSAMFSLFGMLAYLNGRLALEEGRRGRGWVLLALMLVATAAATLSKENGVLVPAFCGVIEWFVFQPRGSQPRARLSLGWIGATLVLPAVVAVALTVSHSRYIVGGYANRSFSLVDRILTQPRVMWDYVGSILLPYGPRLGLYHDDYLISHGLTNPRATLLAIAGWLGLGGVAWHFRAKIPGFAFGVALFLVGHSLESTVFPLLMYFEHRNYLPAVGAIWAILSLVRFGAERLRPRMDHAQVILATAGVALVVVLALATAARAAIWSSLPTLLVQDLANHPESTWLRVAAAGWALDQQPPQSDLARAHLAHLLESPDRDIQRIGAGAYLVIDCTERRPIRAELISKAFSEYPRTMQSDLLTTYETLADTVAKNPCNGLTAAQFAVDLAAMLDRMKLPQRNFMMRRLRYKAARMYLEAGDLGHAEEQAKLAHDDQVVIAPMTALLAEIELRRGDRRQAKFLIEMAAPKVAADDVTGQKILKALRQLASENDALPAKAD